MNLYIGAVDIWRIYWNSFCIVFSYTFPNRMPNMESRLDSLQLNLHLSREVVHLEKLHSEYKFTKLSFNY